MKTKILLTIFIILLFTACQTTSRTQEKKSFSQLLLDRQNYKIESTQENIEPKESQSEWQADVDYDGQNEKIVLENNALKVYKDNQEIWKTSEEWVVANVIIDDLNQDSEIEINFSVEKVRGRYRKNKVFEESDEEVSCFYIFKWRNNKIEPAWLSSPVDNKINKVIALDINNDSEKELAVLEKEGYLSIWSWNGWGFSNDFRSEENGFEDIVEKDNKIYVR